jgi:hypothetical protein
MFVLMGRPWAVDSGVKRKGAGDSTFYGVWEKQLRDIAVEVDVWYTHRTGCRKGDSHRTQNHH